ncbi:MAG: serine protease [Oscillospiraceae bacterium]|nr:serine protease [Oscillospiraceae bacterium]
MDEEKNNVGMSSDAYTAPAEHTDDGGYQFHSPLAASEPPAEQEIKKSSGHRGNFGVRLAVIVLIFVALVLLVSRISKNYSIKIDRDGGGFRLSVINTREMQNPYPPVDGAGYDASVYPWSYGWGTVPAGTVDVDIDNHEWSGATLNVAADAGAELSASDIYEKLSRSVGIVRTSDANGMIYTGIGTVMSEEGYIITNAHLLLTAETIEAEVNGKSYRGKVVGMDNATDLAVISVDAKDLVPAEFGNSDNCLPGEDIYVIGNPVGNNINIMNCMISSVDDQFIYLGLNLSMMQIYASLGMNATGSPVVNKHGQIVGIIDTLFLWSYPEATGMSFAMPMKEVGPVVNELLEYGYIKGRPSSGITASDIPAAAAAYYGYPEGAYITDVNERSTAYAAGVRRGDLIMEANGMAIKTANDLYVLINSMSIGDEINLYLYRSKDTGYVSFKLMEAAMLN